MGDAVHHRQASFGKFELEHGSGALLRVALDAALFEVSDRCQYACDQNRADRGREDEARGIGPDAVDHAGIGGNVSAHHAECFAKCSFDNVDPVRGVVTLGYAATALTVHADRVDLVDIGEGVVFLGEVADRVDWRDVTVHRIDAFERNNLGRFRCFGGEQLFEMRHVVVSEHALFAAGITDSGDHAGVVQLIGEDHAAGQQFAECRERCVVRHIAAGEQ